jgi:hypothetical protein
MCRSSTLRCRLGIGHRKQRAMKSGDLNKSEEQPSQSYSYLNCCSHEKDTNESAPLEGARCLKRVAAKERRTSFKHTVIAYGEKEAAFCAKDDLS